MANDAYGEDADEKADRLKAIGRAERTGAIGGGILGGGIGILALFQQASSNVFAWKVLAGAAALAPWLWWIAGIIGVACIGATIAGALFDWRPGKIGIALSLLYGAVLAVTFLNPVTTIPAAGVVISALAGGIIGSVVGRMVGTAANMPPSSAAPVKPVSSSARNMRLGITPPLS